MVVLDGNACAVMSWEARMLQASGGVLCVGLCTHAARKPAPVFVLLKYTPLDDCSSLLEELRA